MTTSPGITINDQNVHLARSRLYSLVSTLFLEGVTASNLELLQQLDSPGFGVDSKVDLEEIAAAHFDLFQIQIAPYESIFLDDSGMVGGAIAESVMDASHDFGCVIESNEFSFDHIGNELKVIGNLCLAAQLASSRGSEAELRRALVAQHEFLHSHLLRWIHPFVLAVRCQPYPVFAEMADLLLECVHDHAGSLSLAVSDCETATPADNAHRHQFSSAREIAGWFVMPCRCGIYLDKRTLASLGRQAGLPSGFGSRQDMIENLFESAAHYSAVPQLVDSLKAAVAEWESAYRGFAREWPASGMHPGNWSLLTTNTTSLLDELVSLARPV